MKKLSAVIILTVMLILCFTACGGTGNKEDEKPVLFDSFETVDFSGNKVTEDILKGKKVTMINIWGTFCSPCIREMPALNTLNETYADKGFQVIGIVCDVPVDENGTPREAKLNEAKEILKTREAEYLNILPFDKIKNTILAGDYSIPMTYFVDENGKELAYYLGSKDLEDWEKIVDSVFAQLEQQ